MSTTAELVTQVRSRFGEDTAADSQVTDPQIVDFLNEAQVELCSKGNILPACTFLDFVANQQEYALPGDFHRIQAVYLMISGKKRLLDPIGIIQQDPNKRPGDPDRYYIWGANDLVTGLHTYYIGFEPVYASSVGAAAEIFYRRLPVTMVLASVDPEVDLPWQKAIVQGALMRVYERFSSGDDGYATRYARAEARWEKWLVEAESYIPTMIMDRPFMPNDTMGYTRQRRFR